MMKYIDAEKLLAEIKRLHKAHSGKYGCDEVGLNLEYLEDFITSLQQEQPEVDLDALVNEAFDKYQSVDGYGQLSVSFNRAELYSFIKKIARKEE